MRKLIKSLGVAALALATASTVAVAPADAASACKTNTRSLNLPGKPDIKLSVNLCVSGSGSYRTAMAYVSWSGGLGVIGGKRVNLLYVDLRIERNDGERNWAGNYYTSQVNGQYSGSVSFGTTTTGSLPAGGWSADATVQYDIADDGLGTTTWELTGSPLIS